MASRVERSLSKSLRAVVKSRRLSAAMARVSSSEVERLAVVRGLSVASTSVQRWVETKDWRGLGEEEEGDDDSMII